MVYQASDITNVAVIGLGTMGEGIAQGFAEAGLQVHVVDKDRTAMDRGLSQIAANLDTGAAHGLLKDDPNVVQSRITPECWEQIDAVVDRCQLAVETVPEVLDLKRSVFARLDRASPDILLASNTSSFTISEITEAMKTPERVVGIHYFNPAHLIPAVEIHHGARTSDQAIAQANAIMTRIGKVPIRVRKEVPGFIINRLTGALEREIDHLLDEGIVTPEDLDVAVRASLGFRLATIGPMEAEDLIGLDTAARVSNNLFPTLSNATEVSPALTAKVARGELGVKAGQGWYDYSGQSREEVLKERNDRLLRQLRLFRRSAASADDPQDEDDK